MSCLGGVCKRAANYLSELCKRAHAMAIEKGFCGDEPRPIPELLCLMHSEISEALEAVRDGHLKIWYRADGKPEGLPIELADLQIRLAQMCGELGIDLVAAVEIKLAYNATRPHKHGKAF